MIDFTKIFDYIGGLFTKELRLNITEVRQDLAGRPFSLIKPSTAKKRQAILGANKFFQNRHAGAFFNRGITLTTGKKRKSAAKSVPLTRLLFTTKFAKGAFRHRAYRDHLKVFVSRDQYPVHWTQEPISYADIARYNNAGSPDVNPYILEPPLIFPNAGKDDQVRGMKAFAQATEFLNEPATREYIADQVAAEALKKVSITVVV